MSSIKLLLIFIFTSSLVYGQNLIPNGSFEEGVNCPTQVGNVTLECANWYASLIANEGPNPTPEWFHECSEFVLLAPPDIAFGMLKPFSIMALTIGSKQLKSLSQKMQLNMNL